MIVKYARERGYEGEGKDPHLTLGKEYVVIGINFRPGEKPEISILSDNDDGPGLESIEFFDIIDAAIPPNYGFYVFKSFSRLGPLEFQGDFWDKYHDGDKEAETLFLKVFERIKKFSARA
jgi:hypothetical protein